MKGTLGFFDLFDQYVATVGTSATAFPTIPATGATVKKPERIFVQASRANTVDIFIGKTGVLSNNTTGAFVLAPGANSMMPFNDYLNLKHIAASAGQVLFITYVTDGYN